MIKNNGFDFKIVRSPQGMLGEFQPKFDYTYFTPPRKVCEAKLTHEEYHHTDGKKFKLIMMPQVTWSGANAHGSLPYIIVDGKQYERFLGDMDEDLSKRWIHPLYDPSRPRLFEVYPGVIVQFSLMQVRHIPVSNLLHGLIKNGQRQVVYFDQDKKDVLRFIDPLDEYYPYSYEKETIRKDRKDSPKQLNNRLFKYIELSYDIVKNEMAALFGPTDYPKDIYEYQRRFDILKKMNDYYGERPRYRLFASPVKVIANDTLNVLLKGTPEIINPQVFPSLAYVVAEAQFLSDAGATVNELASAMEVCSYSNRYARVLFAACLSGKLALSFVRSYSIFKACMTVCPVVGDHPVSFFFDVRVKGIDDEVIKRYGRCDELVQAILFLKWVDPDEIPWPYMMEGDSFNEVASFNRALLKLQKNGGLYDKVPITDEQMRRFELFFGGYREIKQPDKSYQLQAYSSVVSFVDFDPLLESTCKLMRLRNFMKQSQGWQDIHEISRMMGTNDMRFEMGVSPYVFCRIASLFAKGWKFRRRSEEGLLSFGYLEMVRESDLALPFLLDLNNMSLRDEIIAAQEFYSDVLARFLRYVLYRVDDHVRSLVNSVRSVCDVH